MIKLTLKIFLLFSIVVVLIIIGISSGIINISKINNDNFPEEKILLSRLENLGNYKLITFEVNYIAKDTIKNYRAEIEKNNIRGKLLAIINGSIDACINLQRIEKVNIEENRDTAFILLPTPVLCSSVINYEQSILYDTSFSSEILNQKFIDKYYPNTLNDLKAEAIRMGILDRAKKNAIQILQPIIEETLNKKIVLKFEED